MRHLPRPPHAVFGVLLLALLVPSLLLSEAARPSAAAPPERVEAHDAPTRTEPARVRQSYGALPLSFEANRGQTAADVRFLARGSAYSLYLTGDEITLALRAKSRAAALRLKLVGANREPRAYGLEELEGKSHYLVGRDPPRWRTNVPNFARVKYESVYPGVDVVYYGNQRQLEYDFLVAPGADAGRIALRVEGAKGILVGDDGDLVLPTAAGEVRQHAPRAYQEVGGVRQTVACRYVLLGPDRVGFELGAYDQSLPPRHHHPVTLYDA
jgi:hypothetical protein